MPSSSLDYPRLGYVAKPGGWAAFGTVAAETGSLGGKAAGQTGQTGWAADLEFEGPARRSSCQTLPLPVSASTTTPAGLAVPSRARQDHPPLVRATNQRATPARLMLPARWTGQSRWSARKARLMTRGA